MKTRLMTNKNRNSFRIDVIENNNLKQFYFNNKKDALQYQKKLIHK
jgi:hypothetical protein